MIANYSLMLKSPKCEDGLKKLRYYLGDELIDFIERYYKENILYSKKFEMVDDYERKR
jgi:hypothetical protein